MITATRGAASLLPMWIQFLRPKAAGRIACDLANFRSATPSCGSTATSKNFLACQRKRTISSTMKIVIVGAGPIGLEAALRSEVIQSVCSNAVECQIRSVIGIMSECFRRLG